MMMMMMMMMMMITPILPPRSKGRAIIITCRVGPGPDTHHGQGRMPIMTRARAGAGRICVWGRQNLGLGQKQKRPLQAQTWTS
eukprot:4456220-Karenia_brevis.AAC.1